MSKENINTASCQNAVIDSCVSFNEFFINVLKSIPSLMEVVKDLDIEFREIITSRRGGGKSIYILFDDLKDNNFDYSLRISDHNLNDWNQLSYNNIGNIITNDGNFNVNKDIVSRIEKLRIDYGIKN